MDPLRISPSVQSGPRLQSPPRRELPEPVQLPLDLGVVAGTPPPPAPPESAESPVRPEPKPTRPMPPAPPESWQTGPNGSLVMVETPGGSKAESMLPPPIEPPPSAGAPPRYRWGVLGGMLHGVAGLAGYLAAQTYLRLKDAPTSPVLDRAVSSLTSTRATSEWLAPTYQALEQALLDPEATVVEKRYFGGGINGTYLVTLSNGARGIFKPTQRENQELLRNNLEPDHQGKREQAAYIVDKYLGHMGRVPPTVNATIEGEQGAFMYFVPGTVLGHKSGEHYDRIFSSTEETSYHRLSVFDNVVGNLDRHTGNWMVNERGEVVPIDHGLCFPHRNGPQGEINYDFGARTNLNESDKDALTRFMLRRAEITQELSPLLERAAIDAMFERVQGMLARGRTYVSWREEVKNEKRG